MSTIELKNKTIILTGAAGLLGRNYTVTLNQAGAHLILIDIREDALKELADLLPYPQNVQIYPLDIRNEKEIETLSRHVEHNTDHETELVLINNAAIDPKVSNTSGPALSRLENFSLTQWQAELDVGLTGAMLCCKYFGPLMAKRKKGNIINISSDLGVIAPNQNLYKQDLLEDDRQPVKPVTYSVIKHGIIGLTKYVATYWADQGVRCNAFAPGGVMAGQPDDFVNKISELIPQRRMARKDEYSGAILFLVSDASSYMNGHTLVMDGGRSVW